MPRLLFSFVFLAFAVTAFSQPTIDSIKYVEPDQSIIIVHLNEDVSYTSTFPMSSPDWVIYHDGVAYPAVFVRAQGALDPPNVIRLSLGSPISYSEAHTGSGIEVEYLGTGPAITGTTGTLAAFGPTQAVNNLPLECEMFDPSRFDYSLALTEICAPAEVEYTVAYYVKSNYINSENYNPGSITIRTYWQDGSPRDETYGAEISPGKFEVTFNHVFPNDPSVCFWETYIVPGIAGIGYCSGGGLRKTFTYENHSTDDEGDGIFEFNIDTIRVCLGQDFTEYFTDATYFNCNPQTEPNFANDGLRAVRFTYGTNNSAEPRIQDVLVDGNPVAGPITGPVIYYDSIRSTGVPAPSGWATTEDIAHAYVPGTDAVGQVFEVRMENWGPCNNIFLSEPPIITYSYIKIVDGPIANAGPDFPICANETATMAGAIERTATAGIWSTNTGDGSWTNPNLPTGAVYTPGANDITNGGVWLVLTADDGAAGCPEHADSMYVTINPIPDLTLAVSDDEQCEADLASVVVSSVEAGVEYTLHRNPGNVVVDGPLTGAAGSDITFNFTPAPPTTSTYNVLAEITATGCSAELTDNATVTVNPLADITSQPADDEICETEDVTFEVVDDGNPAVTGYQWQVSTDGGTIWNNVSGGSYSGENTATLSITSTPVGFDGNLYRCELTTGGPCTTLSNEAELTVNPLPINRNVIADDPFMCYNGSTDIEVQNSQNGIEYTLRIGTTDQATLTGDGNNLPFAVGPLTATTTYNVVALNTVTGCARDLTDTPTVTINPELTADIPGLADQCIDDPINLPSVATAGGSGTYSWEWTGTENPADVQNPGSFVTAIDGTHSYTATVTDEGFLTASTTGGDPTTCTAADTEEFEVFPLPQDRNVTVDHPAICYNTATTVNIENSEAGITYELWNNTLATSYGSQVGDGTTLNFPTGNLTASVTFRVLASSPTTPSCEFELTDNPTVTVNSALSVVAGVDDNEICAGTTINLTSTPAGGSGSYTFAWTGPDAFTSGLEDPTDTPTSEGLPHTYNVVVTDAGFTPTAPLAACTATDNINVTVNLSPTVNVTPAPTGVCTNELVNMDGNASTGTGTSLTHLWTGDIIPLSADNIEQPTFATSTPGIYNLTYRATDENGCFDEDMTTLTVSGPTADIEADGVSAETAGICDNTNLALDGNPTANPTAIDNTTHRWTEGAVAAAGALSPMGPGATAETPTFNSGTVGDYTYFYEVQDNNNCFAYDTIIITVSQVGASPLPAAPNPCAGTTVNLDGNPSGGSGVYSIHTWTEDAGNPEAATLTNANTRTPSFTATTPGTYQFDYYVQDNAGCDYTVTNYTITVRAVPNLTNGITSEICSGDQAGAALSISNGPLPVTYSWTAPTYSDGTLSGGSAGTGGTINDNLTNALTNTTETATYSVTPTANGCPGTAEDVVISVKPEPVISSGQTDNECSNVALDYEILLDNFGSGAGVTFTWAAPVTTGSMTGGSARGPSPGTDANITDTFVNKSGSNQTATYTVTPYYDGCAGSPVNVVITIRPEPDLTDNQNPSTCSDVALDYQVLLDNVDPATTLLQWNAPTNSGGMTGGSARNPAATGNLTDGFTNVTGTQQTATYDITPTFNGCVGATETLVVDVNPEAVITTGQNETVCSGVATNLDIQLNNFTNPGDDVRFRWAAPTLSVTTPNFTGGAARTTPSIDPMEEIFINTTGSQQTATFSVIPVVNGCEGDPVNVIIYIDPEPVVTAGQSTDVCSDVAVNYEINVANLANGLVAYTWSAPTNSGGMTGGAARAVAATGNITDSFNNITGSTQTATYTVTPYFNGCPGDPETVVINVDPEPVITAGQNPFTCSSDPLDYEIAMDNFNNPADGVTFTWALPTLDADPDFSGGTARAAGSPANITDTYVNTSNVTLTATYDITPRYNGCDGNQESVVIDVRPEPVITGGQQEIVCSGEQTGLDIALENFTNPGDNVTFTWSAPTLSTTTDFSGGTARAAASLDPIEDIFVNQTGVQQTATYSVTPYYNGCPGTAVNVIIRVNPEPVVSPNQEPPICSDVQLNYQIGIENVDPALVQYTWNAPSLSGGITGGTDRNPAAAGNIDDTFTNTTSATQTATYTVTPYYNGCEGSPETVVVQVAPEPVVTSGQNPETCSQTPLNHYIALDNFASGDGVLYRWAAPTLDADPEFTGGAARLAANGGNLTDTYTNKSSTTLTATYSIIPSLNGCDGDAETLVVDVKPEPEITSGQEVTVCSGEALNLEVLMENFTNPGDNVTFTWAVPSLTADPDFSGGTARPVGNSNNITDVFTNTSGSQQTATYSITPTYDGCDGEVETVTVRVNPAPQMTSPNSETICSDGSPSINFTSDIAATYDWEVTFVSGSIIGTTVGETGTGNIPHTLINNGAVAGTVIYRVVPTSAALCEGAPQNVTITVNAPAIVTATNALVSIAAGDPTPADATGLDVTLSGAAVQGAPAGWVVVDPFPAEGTFDDQYSLNPVFTPSANQETAGYVIVQYITNDPDGAIGPCIPDTAEVYIDIGQLPLADAGNDTTICFEPTIDLTGYIGGAATTGTWSVIAGGGSGTMSASTTTDTVVTATYTFGADEIGVDILTFRLETDDPDGAGPVPAAQDDKEVTINPLPVTGTMSGPDTVCVSTPNLVYSVGLTPGSTYEWIIPAAVGTLDFGGTGLNSNMSIITAAASAGTDSIRIFETNQYGCTDDTVYHPVTVLEQSAPDPISGPASVCAFTENVTYSVPDFPGSTYQWFVPVGAAIVTDPTQSSVDINFSQFSGQIRVVETNAGGCVTNHGPLNVTVNALPLSTINASPLAVCQGANVTFTAGPAGQANYEFFVNGISAQDGASNIFNSTAINNGDQVTVLVTTANGCSAGSNPVQVTVYDLPTVTLVSNDTTICQDTPVTFSASSATAVNYNFFLNGISMQSGGSNTYINTALNDGDIVHVEVLSAYGCPGTSTDIVMTVNDLPEASIDGDHTICPGDSENLVVSVTNGLSPYNIVIDNGIGTIAGYISGNNIPVSPLTSTTYNLIEITDANGCTSTGAPEITGTAVITLRDTVQLLTQPKEASVCEGVDTSFTVGAIGAGLNYEWFVSTTQAGPYSAIPSSNTATLDITTPGAGLDGNYYYVAVSGICDSENSDSVQLVIEYDPVSARDPFDAAICEGLPTGFGVDAGVTEDPVFQWYLSADNGATWDPLMDTAVYSGSNTDSLMISSAGTRFDGYRYYAEITGNCGGSATSAEATLTVYERPEILEQPADTTVCENNAVEFVVDAGATTTPVFQWQVDQRDGAGWEDILGDTVGVYVGHDAATLQVLNPVARFNQYRYRVRVSGDCTPAQTSGYATLTVDEEPEIVTPPTAKTICEEQSTVFSVNAGVTTQPGYTWEVDMGSGWVTIGADTAVYSGFNTSTLILSTVPSDYDGYLYQVTVSGACPNSVTAPAVLLTVNDVPEILTEPVNDTVCETDAANFFIDAGATTVATYQWQVNEFGAWMNIPAGMEGTEYSGINTAALTVNAPDISYNLNRYRAIVSGTCTPPVTSGDATLVIDTRPTVLVDPADRALCEDADLQLFVHAGATTEPTYLWQYSSNGGGSWSDAALLPEVSVSDNDTLDLVAIPSAYDGYLFRVMISGKCTPPVPSASATITVNEKPEIDIQPQDVGACEQDTVIFTVDPGVTTSPTYSWQYFNGSTWLNVPMTIYEGVNNDTLQINGVNSSLNGVRYRVMVSGICSPDSISDEAVLTVDERPEVLGAPLDQTICDGDDAEFGISTGATTSPVVTWEYFDGVSWNGATGGIFSTNANGDTLYLTAADATYDATQYRAIVDNTCGPADTSVMATLTVKNRPAIVAQPIDEVTCEGTGVTFSIDEGITSDPVFQWEVYNGTTWGPVFGAQYTGAGTNTLQVLAPNSSMNGYQYRAILGGYCVPNDTSDVVTLTVNENAEITLQPVNAAICELGDTVFFASAGVTTNRQWQWYEDDGLGGGMTALTDGGVYTGANDSALVITAAPYSMDGYTYQLEVTGDCGAPVLSDIVTLDMYKAPEILAHPQDTTTCELKNVSFTVDVGATEAPFIQWYEDDGVSGMTALTDGGGYIGTNTATLQIFGVDSAMTGYEYEARVTNACGGPLASNIATLVVQAAPAIWEHPENTTICEGDITSFSVTATGENLDYEWFVDDGTTTSAVVNDAVYTGQGTATLQIDGADRGYHLNRYYVRVTGDCQPWVQSNIAFLYVENPPEIQVEPENDTICENGTASFTVNAVGAGLTYQWYEEDGGGTFNPLSDGGYYIGTGLQTMNIFNVDRTYDGHQYRVVVGGTCAPDATSVDVELTVKTPPVITTPPDPLTVCDGEQAEFHVVAEGSDLVYQWKVNKKTGTYVDIPDPDGEYTGATTPDLVKLTTDAATENGYSYRVQVSGACTPAQLSDPVLLNVNTLPVINVQPVDDAVCAGTPTQFSASASGPDLTYQWMVSTDGGGTWAAVPDDAVYDNVDSDQLTINNTTVAMDGNQYRLDVSSSCTPVESDVVTLTVWENPTANITGDLGSFPQLCGGEVLTMDGSPAGGSGVYTNHLWSGDVLHVTPTNQQTAVFETHVRGDYNINYQVTDDNGCTGQASVVVENYRPMAQFTSDATPKCGNLTVNFTNQSSADAVSFNWDFDNGFNSTDEDPSAAFDNFDPSGLVKYYNIEMVATDAQGCKDTAQSVVTIYPKVNPAITATPASGCQPLSVYLETQPGAAAYLWDYGDGTGENGSYTTYHVYANFGSTTETFETVLQTTSAYGCVATDTVDIVVDPIPQPSFSAAPDIQTIPVSGGASVTFQNNTVSGPWTFVYDFGDGSADYTTTDYDDVVHSYMEPGIYTVTLYTNVGDCIDSASTVVTVNPRAPVAGFTSITEGCHPLEVTFTNISQYATTYTWQFGDGSISTEENPTHVFYQPGEYTVKLIANGPGGTDQASGIITVHATPQVFFNYAPDSVFVNDKPVRFFNLTSYADDYYWDFGDYNETPMDTDDIVAEDNNSTLSDPTHIYMYEGWKDVLLIGSNEHCIDSLFIPMAIKVIPAGALRFPNIFRPGDAPQTGVNVNNLTDQQRNTIFFPGVNKQVLEYHMYIYNRWGELIFQSDDINTGWDGFIQGRKAAQGVYIWKVTGIYSNGSPFSDAGDVTLVWQ